MYCFVSLIVVLKLNIAFFLISVTTQQLFDALTKNGQQRYTTTRRQRISLPANLLLTRCSRICAYPPCPSRVYTSFYEGTEYVMKQRLSLARPILQQKSKYPRKILWTMCGVVDFLECRRKQRANITYSFFR